MLSEWLGGSLNPAIEYRQYGDEALRVGSKNKMIPPDSSRSQLINA